MKQYRASASGSLRESPPPAQDAGARGTVSTARVPFSIGKFGNFFLNSRLR
jgi:hypothetical protein